MKALAIVLKKSAIVSVAMTFLFTLLNLLFSGNAKEINSDVDYEKLKSLPHEEVMRIIDENTIELGIRESAWFHLSFSETWLSIGLLFFVLFSSCLLAVLWLNKGIQPNQANSADAKKRG